MGLLVRLLCRRTGFFLVSSLICLSSFAPSRVSCRFEDFTESAGKLMRSVKDSLKDNFAPAMKQVSKTASDAIDVAKKTVRDALGPDLNKKGRESCPREGCPDERGQDTPGGFRPPSSESSGQDEDDWIDERTGVAKVHEGDPGILNMLFGSARTGLATVGRTLYDTINDLTNRFAETVRKIMSEEFYDLMVGSMTKIRNAMFTPGATLFFLGESAATITLVLSCLLLSYLFLRFFSLLFVLAFLSGMFLLHQVLGPVILYEWIFWVGGYFLQVAWFMARHYYFTSVLTVLLFGYSMVKFVKRWCTFNREGQWREDLMMIILEQNMKLNNLTRTLEDSQEEMRRMRRLMERNLDERLQTLADQQTEFLNKLDELLRVQRGTNHNTREEQHQNNPIVPNQETPRDPS